MTRENLNIQSPKELPAFRGAGAEALRKGSHARPLKSVVGHIQLNAPLPWDVLDSRGQILLRKAHVVKDPRQFAALTERGIFAEQEEFERHERENPQSLHKPLEQFDPFWRWETLFRRLDLYLREDVAAADFAGEISRIAEEIDRLMEKDANAGVFAMFRLDVSNYPVAHSLRTACFSGIVARALGLTEAQRLSLFKAALTMNIAMVELQKTLYRQAEPPTEAQDAGIRSHPTRGRQLLEKLGVKDEEWLRAVAEHHETPDGKGYPAGLTSVSPLAEIIYHADVYSAMTCGRLHRKPLPPNQVARKLFVAATSETPIPILLIKKLGIYPPGSFVKLANGDAAVVTRSGESAKSPQVFSLQNRNGDAYVEPVRRDTTTAEYAAVDSVAAETVKCHISPLRLFGYEK